MDNVLLITNADMSVQAGNVTLVNRRAEEIFKQFKVKTTCIVINKKCCKNINHNIAGIEYLTIYENTKDYLKNYIVSNRPKKIIFYGARTYFYITFIKNIVKSLDQNTEILLDIQSAPEERIEASKGINKFRDYAKYLLERKYLADAINSVDGVFVVSDELKEYCYSFLEEGNRNKFEVYKIRCGINEVISTEQKTQWRNEVRKHWGVDDNTIIMVFSGYRKSWQNIDKIIEIFKNYDKKIDKIFFAFFCDLDENFEKQIKSSFPKNNYKLKFLSFEEYFKYLSACDVGFLYRDYNVTNKVAFPNKFSDYLNAGLIVAINKALPEPYRVNKNSDIDFIDIETDNITSSINKIMKRQNDLIKYYKNIEKVCEQELLYSIQIRKQGFNFFEEVAR